MKKLIIPVLIFCSYGLFAQAQVLQATIGVGKSEGTFSVLYGYDFEFGKRKQFAIGTGARFTSYFGSNQPYRTAPAELTTGERSLLVIFKPDIEENIDTLLVQSPWVNSVNLFINLRYKFSNRLHVGFNIDAIGFSFGGSREGTYTNDDQEILTSAKPTTFNVLLTSDNDYGSLNSEFYARYDLNKRWGLKAGAQFHFTEYTTDIDVQQFPEPNDRFRRKSLFFAAGVQVKL